MTLRDSAAHDRGENPRVFPWPKCWLFPYHRANVPPAPGGVIQPPPEEPQPEDLPSQPLLTELDAASAIVESRPLRQRVQPYPVAHVRNHEYLVRWRGHRNTDAVWCPYDLVWHLSAFQDFVEGSTLSGHVPPSQYARFHRLHVNQLLRFMEPDRRVPLADPEAINNILRDYVPEDKHRRRATQPLSGSQAQREALDAQAAAYFDDPA